jgi:hypothetical protein
MLASGWRALVREPAGRIDSSSADLLASQDECPALRSDDVLFGGILALDYFELLLSACHPTIINKRINKRVGLRVVAWGARDGDNGTHD